MYKLRPYQSQAVKKSVEYLKGNLDGGGLAILPTGSGKSLVIASVCKMLEGKTLVLQPTSEILKQNYQKTIDFGFSDVAIFSASLGQKNLAKITFGTIGSVFNKKELFEDVNNIIIDECHLCNSKAGQYLELIQFLNARLIGFTATGYRTKFSRWLGEGETKFITRTRPKIFSKLIHNTEIPELYDLNFLAPVKYNMSSDVDISQLKLKPTGADFTNESLSWFFKKNKIGDRIVNGILRLKDSRKHFLVFNSFVLEAESVSEALNKNGIVSEVLSAKTKPKDRIRILEDFTCGKIKAVINVGVLTTGFDFPELDAIIMARPTNSLSLYYQIIGRGLRKAEGKENCLLIDLSGNVNKFGKIENFETIMTGAKNNLPRLKSNVGFLTV